MHISTALAYFVKVIVAKPLISLLTSASIGVAAIDFHFQNRQQPNHPLQNSAQTKDR